MVQCQSALHPTALYAAAYMADPAKRGPGFMIQSLACTVLLFGALGRIIYSLATGGV